MAATPAISVVIPTHRSVTNTLRAIHSVAAQEFVEAEIIVVVDGMSQMAASLRRELRGTSVRVLNQTDAMGAAAARNRGVKEATSSLVSFLDSDDVWLPTMANTQLQLMSASSPNVVGASTGYWLEGSRSTELRPGRSKDNLLRELTRGCALAPGSTLCIRRSAWLDIGGEDPRFTRLEDWDLLLRLALAGSELAHSSQPLARISRSARGPGSAQVEQSCQLLLKNHLGSVRAKSPWLGHALRAACLYEIGLAHLRNREVLRAVLPVMASAMCDPLPRAAAAMRVLKRVRMRHGK
ncbi:MAG: glycosyltransferase family A protein [Actinomycetota bacterium]|nr:glycosyltransferase family A protein [Actinomycetota bacterium]